MNISIGDLFLVKGKKEEDITFIVLEKLIIKGPDQYRIHLYYPEGKTKIQYLDASTIEHYVSKGEFIHYPVIK